MKQTDDRVALEEKESALKRLLILWKNPDYRLLWSGQTISSLGSGITQLAYPLLVLALTGSPAQAGIVSAINVVTFILFSLLAGAFIDRWDRKRTMIICDTGRMLSLLSIPIVAWLGHLTVVQLYITAFIEGTLYVFFSVAQVSSLPQVVEKRLLPDAMAQNQVTSSTSILLSPPISGTIFALNRVLPFLFDSISYAVSVCSLLFIKTQFQLKREATQRNLRSEIFEGFTFLWRQPLLFTMALISCGINFVLPGETLIVIVQAQSHHVSAPVIGIIFGIGGIGAILGAIFGSALQRRFKFGTIIWSISWLFALLWFFYALIPFPLALGGVYAGIALLAPLYNIVLVSYRLSLTPDELQGRVNSAARLFARGSSPLGLALTGTLLQWKGVVVTVLTFLVVLLVIALTVTLNPMLRNADIAK